MVSVLIALVIVMIVIFVMHYVRTREGFPPLPDSGRIVPPIPRRSVSEVSRGLKNRVANYVAGL